MEQEEPKVIIEEGTLVTFFEDNRDITTGKVIKIIKSYPYTLTEIGNPVLIPKVSPTGYIVEDQTGEIHVFTREKIYAVTKVIPDFKIERENTLQQQRTERLEMIEVLKRKIEKVKTGSLFINSNSYMIIDEEIIDHRFFHTNHLEDIKFVNELKSTIIRRLEGSIAKYKLLIAIIDQHL